MKIIELPLSEIIPYENNPRINADAIDAVAKSIKEFGWNNPIVVDKDKVIVCGHTRLLAAEKLGLKTAPVYVADKLSPEQVKAYRLADNKTAEIASWDFELLPLELRDLQEADFDLTLLGFDMSELETLLGDEGDEIYEGKCDADQIPEVPETPISKAGELYQLGEHRLYCGDSTKKEDASVLMSGEKAALLFTSPPYTDMREYNGGKDLSVEHLAGFIGVFFDFAFYQCVNLGIQRRNSEVVEYWDEYIKAARTAGYKLLSWNVWDKCNVGSIGLQRAMFPLRHEWIFVFGEKEFAINRTWEKKEESINTNRKQKLRRQKDGSMLLSSAGDDSNPLKAMESVLRQQPELGAIRGEHPATFPVGLPYEYILAMTQKGDLVIDPFGGSGSTLIACQKTGRRCRIMELDPRYCDVARKRWAEFVHGEGCDWQALTSAVGVS